jgi:hypothetical protein
MREVAFSIVGSVLAIAALTAQQPSAPPQTPKGQTADLGRPTKGTDPLPLFDFDQYFIGMWRFEWDVPEGPLGPAGTLQGTTTYKPLGGKFYQAETKGTGPKGPFTIQELIAYERENKVVARHVADSRGFAYLQIGPIGGDLGGYYNVYLESVPFIYGGKSIRIRNAMRLLSPTNYRYTTTVSVDDGPFVNYGNPWWRKTTQGAP